MIAALIQAMSAGTLRRDCADTACTLPTPRRLKVNHDVESALAGVDLAENRLGDADGTVEVPFDHPQVRVEEFACCTLRGGGREPDDLALLPLGLQSLDLCVYETLGLRGPDEGLPQKHGAKRKACEQAARRAYATKPTRHHRSRAK